MLEELLASLAASPLPSALRASRYAYPIVNALHIMALATLFGAIVALDLRLLGVARAIPPRPLAMYLPRVAGTGLALAMLTGFALFSVQPQSYIDNPAFLVKIALVAIGAVHALGVHASRSWRHFADGSGAINGRLKLSALISLAIWVTAILAGRLIAF